MLVLLLLGLVNAAPSNISAHFKPPDHVNGLPMERDGHLNLNFRKEILIGDEDSKNPKNVLLKAFLRADVDNDKLLTPNELKTWIASQIKKHFSRAIKENLILFTTLDKNHDGRVTWQEYHHSYLLDQGLEPNFIANHSRDHKTLPRSIKEKILLDKAAWYEAANLDAESLNIDEFLTFRHPEHSHITLLNMVNSILNNLDTNGDDFLSIDEFSEMAGDTDLDSNISENEQKEERKREFKEVIDINHDGKVSRQELLIYNDPENPLMAKREARRLMFIADINKDGYLTLNEIYDKQDLFLGSKMIDSARSFHDEF